MEVPLAKRVPSEEDTQSAIHSKYDRKSKVLAETGKSIAPSEATPPAAAPTEMIEEVVEDTPAPA